VVCPWPQVPGLYERAVVVFEARLAADHPDTVRSRERLAAVALENH
jgi:hypothetical protein